MRQFNERFAIWITSRVATMACAYFFALIALAALPDTIHDSFFSGGFKPQAIVQWFSQSFVQLVLLSIIMVQQKILDTAANASAKEQHDAVLEILQDVRDDHADRHEALLLEIRGLTPDASTSSADRPGS